MRVMIVGATGTIGTEIAKALSPRHDVVKVGASRGDFQVDLASKASIVRLFAEVGQVDAVVSAAGVSRFGGLLELSDDDFSLGLSNKLMGQVNLVRVGHEHVADGGSITLTSGNLSQNPIPGSASITMAGAALEGFVRAAALEMPRGIRVNIVSPGWVKETMEAMGMDSSSGMPAEQVALAYVESVEGGRNGEVLDVRDHV